MIESNFDDDHEDDPARIMINMILSHRNKMMLNVNVDGLMEVDM